MDEGITNRYGTDELRVPFRYSEMDLDELYIMNRLLPRFEIHVHGPTSYAEFERKAPKKLFLKLHSTKFTVYSNKNHHWFFFFAVLI